MRSTLAITGGSLVDGTGSPRRPADVLLRGDEIVEVAAPGALGEGAIGSSVIDATGCTVMPGLIDAHCHSTFDDVQSNDELFFHRPAALAALITAFNLPKLLLAGVTSFFDPDTVDGIGPQVRDALDAGAFAGPRMATGVQALLTSVGGTAGRLIPDEGGVGYAAIVNTVDEMVTMTRRHIKQGADWIKIHATGSIPRHRGELQVWKFEEMRAVCETAHELDTPVTAHCRNASSVRDAARAGVDLILHASFMDDKGLEAVVESGASICPTFTFLANLADYGHVVDAGVGMSDIFRGEISATAAMMRRAYDAGVRLLCGSESGFALTPYGHWHAREMEVFVNELGLTPLEAITCATKNNAFAMRMEGQLGVVTPGARADVLVVAADPTTDVRVLQDRQNLRAVISRGVAVDLAVPWPTRQPIPGSHVANWAAESLTFERVANMNSLNR